MSLLPPNIRTVEFTNEQASMFLDYFEQNLKEDVSFISSINHKSTNTVHVVSLGYIDKKWPCYVIYRYYFDEPFNDHPPVKCILGDNRSEMEKLLVEEYSTSDEYFKWQEHGKVCSRLLG